MSNLFVKSDATFTIKIFVAIRKENNGIFCDIDKNMLEEILKGAGEYEIEEHSLVFRRPSFEDMMVLSESAFTTNDGKNIGFNPMRVRFKKMVLLLKSWTLTDSEPTEEKIRMLDPVVANVISTQLDLETGGILD